MRIQNYTRQSDHINAAAVTEGGHICEVVTHRG